MNRALLIGVALGALAVAYVLWPLLRPARRSSADADTGAQAARDSPAS